MTVDHNRFLVDKTNRCTDCHLYWYYNSTCFGQPFCPSSGVLSRTSALVHFMQLWWPWATRRRMELHCSSILLMCILSSVWSLLSSVYMCHTERCASLLLLYLLHTCVICCCILFKGLPVWPNEVTERHCHNIYRIDNCWTDPQTSGSVSQVSVFGMLRVAWIGEMVASVCLGLWLIGMKH